MKLGIYILEGLRFSSCAFHRIFAYISKVMVAYTFPFKLYILFLLLLIRGSLDYDVTIKIVPEALNIFYTPLYSNNEIYATLKGICLKTRVYISSSAVAGDFWIRVRPPVCPSVNFSGGFLFRNRTPKLLGRIESNFPQ